MAKFRYIHTEKGQSLFHSFLQFDNNILISERLCVILNVKRQYRWTVACDLWVTYIKITA